ncbi:hypothetical protein PV325_009559 [Microctonus aethiopoides]|nr:hypothetical protein PV325_009559 [Microctonus aethiopoides]
MNNKFEIARGHPIERQPYLKALELAPSGEKIISRIHNDLIKDKNNDHRNKNSEYSRWNDDKNNTRKYYPQRDCGPYDRRNDTNRKFKYPRINDQELSKNWRKNESNFSPSTTSSSSSSAPPRGQYDYPPRSFHHNWRESPINNHQNYSRNSNLPDQLIKSNFSLHKEQSEIVNSQNSSTSRLPAARFDNHSSIFYPNWRQSPSNDPQNNPKHVNHPEQLIESKILLHKNQTGVIDPNNSSSNCKVKMEKRGAIRRKDLKYSGKKS